MTVNIWMVRLSQTWRKSDDFNGSRFSAGTGKKITSIARQLASLLAAMREVIARYELASASQATTTRE
jgi:hypothetical protein